MIIYKNVMLDDNIRFSSNSVKHVTVCLDATVAGSTVFSGLSVISQHFPVC